MKIDFKKHQNANKSNRVEFWIINFEYFDGIDLIAKLFNKYYGMKADEKINGVYFSLIRLHSKDDEYELLWHEDMGNIVYTNKQDENSINQLEERLKRIIDTLNHMVRD